jgi:hypothetical protein
MRHSNYLTLFKGYSVLKYMEGGQQPQNELGWEGADFFGFIKK